MSKEPRKCERGHTLTANNSNVNAAGKIICHQCRINSRAHWKKVGRKRPQ